MYCRNCNCHMIKSDIYCPVCGTRVERTATSSYSEDRPRLVLNVLSFILPFIGLFLYLFTEYRLPMRAASLGRWALFGAGTFVMSVTLAFTYFILVFTLFLRY